jgi:hypothetical protein
MGIGAGQLSAYISWAARGWLKPGAAIFDLGAQQLARNITASDPNRFVTTFGGRPYSEDETPKPGDFAGYLFERAGFRYASTDIQSLPFVIPLDLNLGGLPAAHIGRYDLVANNGTSEHIFNQWNVFKVAHDAAKAGGLMYHSVPMSGQFEHGIVNYNPKFFWALAEANGYEILTYEGWTGSEETLPESFLPQIAFNAVPRALKCSISVLIRKTDDRPFAGLIDPAYR